MNGDRRPDNRGATSCPCGRETAYGWVSPEVVKAPGSWASGPGAGW